MGRARVVVKEFLLRNHDRLLSGGEEARSHIGLAKYLNLYGGVTLLDTLSEADVVALLEAELSRIIASQAVAVEV